MNSRRVGLRVFAFCCVAFITRVWAGPNEVGARVVIVANADDADSIALARYYASKRKVPDANIYLINAPLDETISWPLFVQSVWQPLQDRLLDDAWLKGISSTVLDAYGRKKIGLTGHHIDYLVVCKGIPLRIREDPELEALPAVEKVQIDVRTVRAAVDSELSLLCQDNPPVVGFVHNPLYRVDHPTSIESNNVIRVSRLDGPTYADAKSLIDSAAEGESRGLIGRYYVDFSDFHPDGNRWLSQVRERLDRNGFEGDVDTAPGTFPETARFDAPALYFGWYAKDMAGPMALPGFRFPPGAIAFHIHSYSATTLASATSGWAGPLVARGVAATMGNVFEPYLQLTQNPAFFISALLDGKTLGEAAYYATPVLSWQTILLGDPLYRPFAVQLEEQMGALASFSDRSRSYVVARWAERLRRQGSLKAAALTLETAFARDRDSLVLALELAQHEPSQHLPTLFAAIGQRPSFAVDELGLALEAAAFLEAQGDLPDAEKLYRIIKTSSGATPEIIGRLTGRLEKISDNKKADP